MIRIQGIPNSDAIPLNIHGIDDMPLAKALNQLMESAYLRRQPTRIYSFSAEHIIQIVVPGYLEQRHHRLIPPQLSLISQLRELIFANISLVGSIPSDLGLLTNLQKVLINGITSLALSPPR